MATVGASGIRRRNPVHHLPKSHEHYSDAELGRVFGQFQWGAYTPAGTVERVGFLARQASRRRRHPEWREYNRKLVTVGEALLIIPYATLLLVGLMVVVDRLFGS
jgi:hypothetical protein